MDEMKRIQDFVEATFGSHDSLLAHQIITHSIYALPCDVTFRDRKPFLDVTIDEKIGQSLMSGAALDVLHDTLNYIRFSNGESARFNDVLLIVPMPVGGVSQAAMDAVDLSEADDLAGLEGETTRDMIREVYRCETRDEEEHFLRRYLAS
jgi:hypothetical protein